MSLQAVLLIWLGFSALAMAMPRHGNDVLAGKKLSVVLQRLLQLAGTVLLCASLWLALQVPHLEPETSTGINLAVWTGQLTLVLVLLTLVLSYRPRWLLISAVAAVLAVGVLA